MIVHSGSAGINRHVVVAPFLGLPPGFRFLFVPGAVDIWFDESLLKV